MSFNGTKTIANLEKLSKLPKEELDKFCYNFLKDLKNLGLNKYESRDDIINECITEYNYWYELSSGYYLSEDFIEKYKDYVAWEAISIFQKLSEEFIEKYKDYIYWIYISQYQKLSPEFIKKYKKRLRDLNKNYLILSNEERRNKIIKDREGNDEGFYFYDNYFLGCVATDSKNQYRNGRLIRKLEIGKVIESDDLAPDKFSVGSVTECIYLGKRSVIDDPNYFIVKCYYEDLECVDTLTKITPIAKFSKGWKLKIE